MRYGKFLKSIKQKTKDAFLEDVQGAYATSREDCWEAYKILYFRSLSFDFYREGRLVIQRPIGRQKRAESAATKLAHSRDVILKRASEENCDAWNFFTRFAKAARK